MTSRTQSVNVAKVSSQLQVLQKQRAWHMKSRIMVENRLRATVAGAMGYHTEMKEAERKKLFEEADEVIKAVSKGEKDDAPNRSLIMTTLIAVDAFRLEQKIVEKAMVKLAKSLPTYGWVEEYNQRGFGKTQFAVVVGEAGDLSMYANPGKLWKRLGCAPYEKGGVTLQGATWKSRSGGKRKGLDGKPLLKLESKDWEDYGYSPRRRSISYLIGVGIVKQNQGEYRQRYDEVKATKTAATLHDDEWTPLRIHRHAMLLATKRLLKNLWVEWTGYRTEPTW